MKSFYITTSIAYVNASPHIGFALEQIQADAAARYWRAQLGDAHTYFLTGTDENSLKNVRAAEEKGISPEQHVAELAEEFRALTPMLNLSNNDFIRTREERHMKGAQKLWSNFKPEDVYTKEYTGLYCVGCEAFYTDDEAIEGNCPTHKKPLETVQESNYFFKLSNYQDQIEELIESDQLKIFPETRKNEILSFVKSGLQDFSISRSVERARNFGVPVPGDDSQVMYVWVDALSNYITGLGYADDAQAFKTFWLENEYRVHVIGKDIIRFHAVYWPAMLLSAGLPVPTELFVHGFFTVEGEKMSKSIGNVLHPKELVEEYGVDAMRYFLLRELPYAADGDVSTSRIEQRYAELANQLGNLVSRVAAMANKYFDGVLPGSQIDWTETETTLQECMSQYNFRKYIDEVFTIVGEVNELIDKKEPFKLVKTDEEAAKAVLAEAAEKIRFIGQTLLPIIPEAAAEIVRRYAGDKIEKGDPLFLRRD